MSELKRGCTSPLTSTPTLEALILLGFQRFFVYAFFDHLSTHFLTLVTRRKS